MKPHITINDQFNGIELTYSQKPGKEILDTLHAMGFKWSPKHKHWYKKDVGGSLAGWLKSRTIPANEFEIILLTAAAAKSLQSDFDWLHGSLSKAEPEDGEIELRISKASKERIAGLAKVSPSRGGGSSQSEETGEVLTNDFVTMSGLEVYSEENDPYKDEPGLGKAVVNEDVYKKITEMVIETMEKTKDLAWRKPWSGMEKYGIPATNFVSKKPYRGANAILLNFILPMLRKREWDIPYFLTFKQVKELGGKVKKGAQGYVVTYFQMIYKKGEEKISEGQYWNYYNRCAEGEVWEGGQNVCAILKDIPILRYYMVFNAEDIEGIDWKLPKADKRTDFERIATGEAIILNYPKPKPKFIHVDPDGAWYRPSTDELNMPPAASFEKEQWYYSVFFHEMIHSTGAKNRLNREFGHKGTDKYRFEELIAELGATFLCGESGILYYTIENSAIYLKGYKDALIKAMKKDPKFFFKAASKAQAAADFILQRDKDGVPKYLKSFKASEENPPSKGGARRAGDSKKETERKAVKAKTQNRKPKTSKMEPALAGLPEPREPKTEPTEPKVSTPTPEPAPIDDDLKDLGVMTPEQILNTKFDTLPFDGLWGEFMQNPGSNLKAVIYGRPKNGKTSFAFQWADYLSIFGRVLYVLADQGIGENTKRLINEMGIGGNDNVPMVAFRELSTLDKYAASGKFRIIFIDLINNFQITAAQMENFMQKYPDIGFILVMESTKAGDFRGEQKWTHIVDSIINVENWVATNTGRYGSGVYAWEKPEAIN